MTKLGIERDAEKLGFYAKRLLTGGRPATRWACKCSKCDEETTWGWSIHSSPELMVKSVQKAGWEIQHKQLVCPKCVASAKEAKQMNKTVEISPVSNPKLQRKVFALLDDHFDEDKRLYRSGWTDKKIAEAADTSEQFVVSLRRGAYGELAEDPAITSLKHEIIALKEEAKKVEDELLERMMKIDDKITQLHMRIDGYAMKKVV